MESYPYPENTGVGGVDGVGKLDRGLGFTDVGGVSHV
jgi:hypothetical protein